MGKGVRGLCCCSFIGCCHAEEEKGERSGEASSVRPCDSLAECELEAQPGTDELSPRRRSTSRCLSRTASGISGRSRSTTRCFTAQGFAQQDKIMISTTASGVSHEYTDPS